MLVSSQLFQAPTVERLVTIWTDRYLPDLSILSLDRDPLIRSQLREAASQTGRAQTVAKLQKSVVEDKCKLAAVRMKDFYDHLPKVCDLMEAVRLSQFASRVYLKLLEVYQASPSAETASKEELWATFGDSPLSAWGIPKIDKLAETLEPLLLDFQEQYMLSKDWRILGFITTQLNFSNTLLLEELTPAEQALLTPYLNFVEEQIALPWQRICAAAAKHELSSPAFVLVERLLPLVPEISTAVYDRLQKSFPTHYSRRGRLENSAIKHSCLRDFSMFQAYLWLCVLQGNLKVVEQELVALCIMVLDCVDVSWQMTIQGTETLMSEVSSRLSASEKALVQPYAEGMVRAFQQHGALKH
ncbi:MAG TPA: hypothetical protein V6D29_22625 [Leptolyngbyaceae cyanobacterium]